MNDAWLRELNEILYSDFHGMQFCDLDDGEQSWITVLADFGYTPAEAISVLQEGPC